MEEQDIIIAKIEYAFSSLKTMYKFDFELKREQTKVICDLINKKNVLGLLPTGYGKSMCFILPPLILDEASNYKYCPWTR